MGAAKRSTIGDPEVRESTRHMKEQTTTTERTKDDLGEKRLEDQTTTLKPAILTLVSSGAPPVNPTETLRKNAETIMPILGIRHHHDDKSGVNKLDAI